MIPLTVHHTKCPQCGGGRPHYSSIRIENIKMFIILNNNEQTMDEFKAFMLF